MLDDHFAPKHFVISSSNHSIKTNYRIVLLRENRSSSEMCLQQQPLLRLLRTAAGDGGAIVPLLLAGRVPTSTATAAAAMWVPPPTAAAAQGWRSSSSIRNTTTVSSKQPPRLVLYRGKWLTPVRYAVRCKVAQLMAAGGVAAGVAGLTAGSGLSALDAAALAGIAAGSVGGSLALWYYGRRYVGELSLLEPRRDTLRFSVLDFWGNREDVDVPISALSPPPLRGVSPKAANELAAQLLFPVNVAVPRGGGGGGGGDSSQSGGGGGGATTERRQFYLSFVAGVLHEPRVFMDLLKGEYVPPLP
jgi:hypothetical protein